MKCRSVVIKYILIICPSEKKLYPFCDNYCDQYSVPEVEFDPTTMKLSYGVANIYREHDNST